MEACPPEEQLEGIGDRGAAIVFDCSPQLGRGIDLRAGMGPSTPNLTPVARRCGALGPTRPYALSGFMMVSPRSRALTILKIVQWNPLVVHSSIQVEL